MKSDEAMDFLTRIRKTLPGIENFLQATLVKEHLSKVARDELHSLLHLLSHIQLAALPSQGKKPPQRPATQPPLSSYSSTSNVDSERTQSLSASLDSSLTHTETDTEQSVPSLESSPFSSPTRTIGLVSDTSTNTEVKACKTECAGSSRVIECKKSSERQPIAVSRSGRAIKVATGRINSDYVTGSVTRGKRRKRESSVSTLSPSLTKKHKPNQTHNPSQEHPACRHISTKSSITNWTEPVKRSKQTPVYKNTPEDTVQFN